MKRKTRIRQRANRLEPEKVVRPVVAVPVLPHFGRLENANMVVVDERVFRRLAEIGKFPRFKQRLHPASFPNAKRRLGRSTRRDVSLLPLTLWLPDSLASTSLAYITKGGAPCRLET